MVFIIFEALIGAWLVFNQLVAQNESLTRAYSGMAHLVNTFLLIAVLVATAWWASVGEPDRLRLNGVTGYLIILGALGVLVLGASGAVTALGDTLYPSGSLAQGVAQDFSPTASYLTRIRIYHPMIAITVGVYLFVVTGLVRKKWADASAAGLLMPITSLLFGLYSTQIMLGVLNVALLAPVWLQIVHLLVSNLVWITFILLGTIVFSGLIRRRAEAIIRSITK